MSVDFSKTNQPSDYQQTHLADLLTA